MNVQRKVWEFVKTSIIILLTTLLLIVSLEIFLRYFFPQKTQASSNLWHPLSSPDDQLGYVLRPNSHTIHWNPEFYPDYEIEYKINKQGFRDHQIYNQSKAQNTVRLLILGDSFTFGVANNYSKIWTVIFENELKQQNYSVEVMKAGVHGYDTRKEILYLKGLYNSFKPDVVVITFLFNDLFTNLPIKEGPQKARKRKGAEKQNKKVKDHIKPWDGMRDIVSSLHVLELSKRVLLQSDSIYSKIYLITQRRIYFDKSSQVLKRQLDITKELFAEVVKFAELNAFQLIVFSIPQQFQVINRQRTDLEVDYVDREFKHFAEQQGFHWISSLDVLSTIYNNEKEDLYYRIDGHLNNKGNRVVGEYFAAETVKILKNIKGENFSRLIE